MAIGDVYHYSDGRPYIETEHGPNIWWTCRDCGAPAAASFGYTGIVRCSGCWPKHWGIRMEVLEPYPKSARHLYWHSLRDGSTSSD